MYIPPTIKIGGITYKIQFCELGESLEPDVGGQMSADKCLIRILKGDPQFMDECFLHELFHAINIGLKEETVEFLAQSLYQIIVDNPSIFKGGDTSHDRRKK
jgi:hypothetical protein